MLTLRRGWLAISCLLVALGLLGGCESSPTAPSSQLRFVYAALGASDAVGIGAIPISEGYVFEIADKLRSVRANVQLVNLGINGARIERFLAEQLQPAIASNPQIITIWTGSNDVIGGATPAAFGAELDTLLGQLRSRTSALIAIGDLADLTQAPLFRALPNPNVTSGRIAAFNARIAAAASTHGAELVRISNEPLDDSLFSADGFHPSNAGHDRLAEVFWRAIGPRLST